MNDLDWHDGNLPVSTRFDDAYYSKDDGRAETSHVFIGGNRLVARWPGMKHCTLAELGFGVGLNFLETVRQWQLLKPKIAKLRFISFEKYPVEPEAIDHALSRWSELKALSKPLIEHWNPAAERIEITLHETIHLTVHIGDANELLPNRGFKADAWYLDGFSPAKNPELWNEKLMAEIAAHTKAKGTIATYSAAGHVRRALQTSGFEMQKVKGFGTKRAMLTGRLSGDMDVVDGH